MKMKKVRKAGWEKTATPEEIHLVDRVYEFAPLFGDMLFQKGAFTEWLGAKPSLDKKRRTWIYDMMGLPPQLSRFSYDYFRFKVLSDGDKSEMPYYCHGDQELCVRQEDLDNDSTILHELIHLHLSCFLELPQHFSDIYFWALYQHVKQRIPRLDEIITQHASNLAFEFPQEDCSHSLTFLLKSFDLDMRKGYRLGTVFAYGLEGLFGDYAYIPYQKN